MTKIDRRQFLGTSAKAASAFMIVPRHVLGGSGQTAPSDKLNVAGIGVGGQGGGDIRAMESENVVALCDVDWERAARSFERFPEARRYKDFRIMLEKEKGLDAIVIGTPDHTHAVATMASIQMGKHVYCEKPLTHTLYEARTITEAARKAGVVTQMGNQGHAMESIRILCEWIWDGAIGNVTEVHAWTPHPVWPQGIDRPRDTPPVPDTLDWDLWLGPAPYRPYHPAYLPRLWRGWWDYGTSGLGDMGCHIFDHIVWSLKLGSPTWVEGSHSWFVPDKMTWDKPVNTETYPRASLVTYSFPAREGFPPLKLTWYDGGLMPPTPEGLAEGLKMGDTYGGALYVGDKGMILTGSHGANGLRILPEERMQDYERPPETLPRSIGHKEEWIAACKGQGPTPGANFDYSGPMTETVLLGVLATRMGKKLYWDPDAMKFSNCPEAAPFVHKEYREGWSL
ncbi:MAG TPA: Gfo/Idh/MocA family oxidoreductase [Candidatus Desulfaltia sp.]|nr:Gfo/Idh/MocA family oxidoreductase [Candidatus Desulfaltia sp.]